jgi:hypothetical protein
MCLRGVRAPAGRSAGALFKAGRQTPQAGHREGGCAEGAAHPQGAAARRRAQREEAGAFRGGVQWRAKRLEWLTGGRAPARAARTAGSGGRGAGAAAGRFDRGARARGGRGRVRGRLARRPAGRPSSLGGALERERLGGARAARPQLAARRRVPGQGGSNGGAPLRGGPCGCARPGPGRGRGAGSVHCPLEGVPQVRGCRAPPARGGFGGARLPALAPAPLRRRGEWGRARRAGGGRGGRGRGGQYAAAAAP